MCGLMTAICLQTATMCIFLVCRLFLSSYRSWIPVYIYIYRLMEVKQIRSCLWCSLGMEHMCGDPSFSTTSKLRTRALGAWTPTPPHKTRGGRPFGVNEPKGLPSVKHLWWQLEALSFGLVRSGIPQIQIPKIRTYGSVPRDARSWNVTRPEKIRGCDPPQKNDGLGFPFSCPLKPPTNWAPLKKQNTDQFARSARNPCHNPSHPSH